MEYSRHALANGLEVLHIPMSGVHSVSIAIFVGFGSRYERDREAGAAHMLEHMLFKGTERRPRAADISRTLDSVGGMLNASTDKEMTVLWAKVAAEHFPLALDLLADMVLHSRLAPTDVAREKRVILEELSMLADDPQDWVHVLAEEVLWPHQPMGREVAGNRESVSLLRTPDLRRMFDAYYGANNAAICVAGGIDLDRTIWAVESQLGSWRPVEPSEPAPARATAGPRMRVEQKPTEQVNLCLAYPAVHRDHPDRWPIELLTAILGGGTSSRLFLRLREQLGLAYDVHAYSAHYSDAGSVVVYAGTEAGKSGRVLEEICREMDRVRRRRVSADELQRAQQYFRGRLWLGLEDTQAVASWFGSQQLLLGRVVTPDEVIRAVDQVTPDDLLRVARAYMRPDQVRVVAVGPVVDLDLDARLMGA